MEKTDGEADDDVHFPSDGTVKMEVTFSEYLVASTCMGGRIFLMESRKKKKENVVLSGSLCG